MKGFKPNHWQPWQGSVPLWHSVLIILMPAAQARITRIMIDKKVSLAVALKQGGFQSFGDAGHYETIAGRTPLTA